MNAAPFNLAHAAPEDFRGLVPIEEAAPVLGLRKDSLRRACRDTLRGQGYAVLAKRPCDSQQKWFVRSSYDTRLMATIDPNRYTESDLNGYSERQRNEAIQRRACVERLRAAMQIHPLSPGWTDRIVPQIVAALHQEFPDVQISRSSLLRWHDLYQHPADLVKLVHKRGGRNAAKAPKEYWDIARDFDLHQNHPAAREVWKHTEEMAFETRLVNTLPVLSYSAFNRQLKKQIPPEIRVFHRTPAKWRKQLQPYIAQQIEAWKAGECWVSDWKQCDVIVRFGKQQIRPWFCSMLDWRTRKIVSHILSDVPNSSGILACLRMGILDSTNFGGPAHVWWDNGRDFSAYMFHGQTKAERRETIRVGVNEPTAKGLLAMLQIEPHFSLKYNPNGKSRLERFHRSLTPIFRTCPGYVGESADTKPERQCEIADNARGLLDFESFRGRMNDQIAGYNASADHSIEDLSENGVPISPNEAYARWCPTRRVMENPKCLDLLLQHWHRPVAVGRQGISIPIHGVSLHFGQFNAALMPFKALHKKDRRPVHVSYDPNDLRRIQVWDEQYRWVTTAEMNELGGLHSDPIGHEKVGELMRAKTQYNRSLKHVAKHSLTSCFTAEERLAHAMGGEHALPEPSLRLVPAPITGLPNEPVVRQEMKAAVGAEELSPPVQRVPNALQKLRERRENEDYRIRPVDDADEFDASSVFEKLRRRRDGN